MKIAPLVVLSLACAVRLGAQPNTLLPVPRRVTSSDGRLRIDASTRVALTGHRDARVERALRRAIERLGVIAGVPLPRALEERATPGGVEVHVERGGAPVQQLGEDESYALRVTPDGALLSAVTPLGALRGVETLVQLAERDGAGATLAATTIDDAPRFPWRGLLLDVSRHFMPLAQVKKTIDGMAMVKLNVLHWHLTDDQGFRIESKRWPRLHRMGSDGDFYTQAEVREVVAYALDRGIRVVPELDMPGHTTSWFVGYPRYSAQQPPIAIRRQWGGADAIFDPTREEAYTFIASVIEEFAPLFPDAYWHVGGDEVESKHWDSNRAIVAWRKRHGMRDNAELQAYFNRRLTRILTRIGKRMIGWDEILHPGLPPQTVVQSWRGTQYLADAAKRGFSGILSAPWYLDYMKPAAEFYAADPVPQFDELTPEQKGLVLGGEACMWAEYVSAATADSRIWPRLGAIAERLWSPREVTDVDDMYRRLGVLTTRLEAAGFQVASHPSRMLREIAPGLDVAPVESLFVVTQPPRFGQSRNGAMQTQGDALTRVVDAARPDPDGRYLTERLVRRLARDRGDGAARDSLRALFDRWGRIEPSVRTLASRSAALSEAIPAAAALSRAAAIGREALGHLASEAGAPPGWASGLAAELKGMEGPHGMLRLAIASDIAKLVAIADGH